MAAARHPGYALARLAYNRRRELGSEGRAQELDAAAEPIRPTAISSAAAARGAWAKAPPRSRITALAVRRELPAAEGGKPADLARAEAELTAPGGCAR